MLNTPPSSPRRIAVVGAGMAGTTCARTLVQAGHEVVVFEQNARPGGRMTSVDTPGGSFDAGAQYFTLRDPRFALALDQTVPGLCRPWSATAIRQLDEDGRATQPQGPLHLESHWVATPDMGHLVRQWAAPLQSQGRLLGNTQVVQIERDLLSHAGWQLRVAAPDTLPAVHAGFDAVVLALPAPRAQALLAASALDSSLTPALTGVNLAPCWTLMLSYPQAMQPGLTTLGPQWNVARSTLHPRVAWLARESSKPGRSQRERWTVHASPGWSREHVRDDPQRVQAKLHRAFADITGIQATPGHMAVHLWQHAQTQIPLGQSHVWDEELQIGACGDWCLGMRVEDAFVSGLEMALSLA